MNRAHLLLLHGALGASDQFESLGPLLEESYQLHTLDFEGHGKAPMRDRSFRAEHFVENVLDYLSEQAIEWTHIFGYSLGGYVACMVAKRHPGKVERIAALGTRWLWDEETARREVRYLDVDTIREKVPRFAEELAQRHTATGWERVVNESKNLLWSNTETGGLTPEFMADLHHPVRVMVGDRDHTAGVAESMATYQALPNGEFEVLPNTPHPFPRVPMERLAFSLREFFA